MFDMGNGVKLGMPLMTNDLNFLTIDQFTQSDLDDYKRRLAENSPSPGDAFRYAALRLSLTSLLGAADKEKYDTAIMITKGKNKGTIL